MRTLRVALVTTFSVCVLALSTTFAQSDKAYSVAATHSRLNSLRDAIVESRQHPRPPDGFRAIPNRPWRPVGEEGEADKDRDAVASKMEAMLQSEMADGPVIGGVSFQAVSYVDNVTPADPTGDVGPSHIMVGYNSSIIIFNKDGSSASGGPFDAATYWGNGCNSGSYGDPVILYDEMADRWVVELVNFSNNLLCIAASTSSNALGGYNAYVFDFGNQLPDYAKMGLTANHVVVSAHMFGAFFSGTLFGSIDKANLYAGNAITLVYHGGYPYGYLPVDVDGPSDKANPTFVGFENSSALRVYELQNINYSAGTSNVVQVSSLNLPSVDRTLCNATRSQCIDQPASWNLESLDGRLMHRAQMRDMGSRESIVFSQTVDAGSGRAGIAWYELRNNGSGWQSWQNAVYAPSDGEYRWIPSIAMNDAGDIGMSFMRTSPTVFPSVSVVGQTASEGSSASGLFDSSEITCTSGSSSMDQSYKRSGDYAATIVDPLTDKFWAIQQYGYPGLWADWAVWVCEFAVTPPIPVQPVAAFVGSPTSGDNPLEVQFTDQSTGIPTSWNWSFGDGGTSTEQNPTHIYTAAATYTVTLTATNDLGSDGETKSDYITVTEPPPLVDHYAASQTQQWGTSSGSLSDTYENGGGVLTITEEESGGNPSKRRSLAEVTWQFPVRNGKPATFYFNGWHPGSSDGDTFELSYSTDNVSFTTMFEVTETSDIGDVYMSYPLGITSTSTIWIRANDTDRTQGHNSLDQLYIDHMYIETLSEVPSPPGMITNLAATANGFDTIDLTFTDDPDAAGYTVERGTNAGGPYTQVGTVGTGVGSYSDTGLEGSTTYYYVLGAFNTGGTTYSNEASATTEATPAALPMHVASLAGSGTNKNRWVATASIIVHDNADNGLGGVLVSGSWTGGETGSGSCTTDSAGLCNVTIGTRTSSVTFTITGLTRSGFYYDPDANEAGSTSVVIGKGSAPASKLDAEIPEALTLRQNYPNPFNPVTILEYGLPSTEKVTVSVYNALGIEVTRLVDESQDAGWHRVAFDGTNLSSGMYVAVIRAAGSVQSKRMLLSK